MSKKNFVPDFAKILYVRLQGHKDQKFWVSSKSESENFFDPKGGPFYVKKIFVEFNVCVILRRQ